MLGEWIIVTPRSPVQGASAQCPFCQRNKELSGDLQVLTVQDEFPALDPQVGVMPLIENYVIEAPAYGFCKTIILSPRHDEQIEVMSDNHLEKVFREYLRVFQELDKEKGVEYIYEFENRRKLNHPHAQVYALPFVPPRIKQELTQFRKMWEEEEQCLVCQILKNELKTPTSRIILETDHFVSLVPHFARGPYEVHIYPREHVGSLVELDDKLLELGKLFQNVVQRYSKIFDEPEYVMAFHTRPSKGKHPYWHFHIELQALRKKCSEGVETGIAVFTNDSCPEDNAKELREMI
jgi:UDPglucose--hexose-1-phosphate uridylyltransferase